MSSTVHSRSRSSPPSSIAAALSSASLKVSLTATLELLPYSFTCSVMSSLKITCLITWLSAPTPSLFAILISFTLWSITVSASFFCSSVSSCAAIAACCRCASCCWA